MKILICKDKKTEYEARIPSAGKSNANVRRGKKVTRTVCQARERVTRIPSAAKSDADAKLGKKVAQMSRAGKGNASAKRGKG